MRNWPYQPPVPYGISTDPLARDLTLAGYGNCFLYDVKARTSWIANSSPTQTIGPSGKAWRFDGTASYLSRPKGSPVRTTKNFSMAFAVTPQALAADKYMFTFGNSDTGNNPIVALKSNSTTSTTATFGLRDDASGGTVDVVSVANVFVVGKETVLIGTYDGATAWLYTPIGANSAAASVTVTVNQCSLGCLLRAAAAAFAQVDVSWWALWDRVLSAQEAFAIIQNRWRIFTYPAPSVYAKAPAAAGVTTIGPQLTLLGVGA